MHHIKDAKNSKIEISLTILCRKCTCYQIPLVEMQVSQHFSKLKYFTFVPDRPEKWNKHPNDWLDSKNIQSVMNQYEKAYERFRFIGPSPIDYDKKNTYTGEKCVWFDLCQFKLIKYLKQECYQIGIIFNTDNHRGGG